VHKTERGADPQSAELGALIYAMAEVAKDNE
jgi:hypothetical protein